MANFVKVGNRRINLDHVTDIEEKTTYPAGPRRTVDVYLTSISLAQWGTDGGAPDARLVQLTDPAEIEAFLTYIDSGAILLGGKS